MELKEIITFFKTNFKVILIATIISGLLGVAGYFLLPKKYHASGSLFVRRSIYPYSENHFTYEGYYGQQAALAYTNSIIALIESEDIRATALKELNVEVNEATLRKYEKKIKTVKSGPQLVELVIKEKSQDKANKLWNAVADSTIVTMSNISRQNDPFVGLVRVSSDPIVKQTYRNVAVCAIVGLGLGLVVSTGLLVLYSYLPNRKRK
ncbi:YveK family protein [Patescibacteria group bacterium]